MTKQKQIASGAEAIIYLQESSNNISPKKSNNKKSEDNKKTKKIKDTEDVGLDDIANLFK